MEWYKLFLKFIGEFLWKDVCDVSSHTADAQWMQEADPS